MSLDKDTMKGNVQEVVEEEQSVRNDDPWLQGFKSIDDIVSFVASNVLDTTVTNPAIVLTYGLLDLVKQEIGRDMEKRVESFLTQVILEVSECSAMVGYHKGLRAQEMLGHGDLRRWAEGAAEAAGVEGYAPRGFGEP